MARTPKKPRYKEFSSFENTYVFNSESRKTNYYDDDTFLTLELGCGKAEPTLALAKKYPERNFIGIDTKADRLWRPAKNALELKISNVRFLKMHIRFLDQAFEENSVEEIWLTFSDPYPKARQEKHRLTHPVFLAKYKKILKPGGLIHLKTDDTWFFDWSIAQFINDDELIIRDINYDLHNDNQIKDDNKIMTYYEKKFTAEGKKIKYCQLTLEPMSPNRLQT